MLNLELWACNPKVIERHHKVNPCKRMEQTPGKGKLGNERKEQDRILMTSFDIQLCLKLVYPLFSYKSIHSLFSLTKLELVFFYDLKKIILIGFGRKSSLVATKWHAKTMTEPD